MNQIEEKIDNLEVKSWSKSQQKKHKKVSLVTESDFTSPKSVDTNTSEVIANYQQIDNLEWLLKRTLET